MTEESTDGVIGHDSPMDKQCRVYASISFAVLLLGIGLPLWWETTAVPRVTLPYSGIKELSQHELRIHQRLLLGCLEPERCGHFAVEMMSRLTDDGKSDIYSISLSHFATNKTSIGRATKMSDLDKAVLGFDLKQGDILVLEAPKALGEDFVHVTSGRSIYFGTKTDGEKLAMVLRRWLMRDSALSLTRNALAKPTEFSLDVENRRRFPASPNYDILLTIVNPEPENIEVDFDVERVARQYIEPFAQELGIVANFSIKSQSLYMMPLGVKPTKMPDGHYALSENLLPQIITPLEKKLASQVSLYPTINLVIYVVPCSTAPLHIYLRSGRRLRSNVDLETFHSPRWGGITLVNPPEQHCLRQSKAVVPQQQAFQPDEKAIVRVLLTQLRLLLGITNKEPIDGASIAPLEGLKPRAWELDELLRIRTVEQLTSAKLTLRSLARLLRGISNIVITDTVGNRINNALKLIEIATKLLDDADLARAFLASKEAFREAEAAFTDPSLLALLYFPDDQKYAVYIPLFLPVMIPVLFSLKNIKNYLFCSD